MRRGAPATGAMRARVVVAWCVALASGARSSPGVRTPPVRITFFAAARKRLPVSASPERLCAFFHEHPSIAAAELLAPHAYEPTATAHSYTCELEEVSMLGQSFRPRMRVSLSHAPITDGRAVRGAWLVRSDELQVSDTVGSAMNDVSFAAETLISWERAAGASAQLCAEVEMRVGFRAPRGFRRGARGAVERIGSAALSALLAASLANSLRSTLGALERWAEGLPDDAPAPSPTLALARPTGGRARTGAPGGADLSLIHI